MILGGVVGGQRGVAFGGILGIFLGYAISDDYPSLIDVIKRLTDEEKKELWMKCREHFGVATRETLNTVIDTEEKKVAFLKFLKRTVKEVKRT
ncbi:unnamed protein product [Lymnaea stagnalis]|uniref:Uncharacterized protein n=1 Tax=Lymnaea stagnalis TaxID=6523 RepID=A0AAV2HGN2_LYMST